MPSDRTDRRFSHSFACHTPAAPAEVWSALTDASRTPAFLHGLALRSTWEPGAAIVADHAGTDSLTGEVVCARPGERLSLLLRSGASDPSTYVTWALRPNPSGTTVALDIDEPDAPGSDEDAEDTWLPVLEALQRHLREPVDRPGG